nr:MAG TPA: hypothetical protein [Caudoviricetes sp.]
MILLCFDKRSPFGRLSRICGSDPSMFRMIGFVP